MCVCQMANNSLYANYCLLENIDHLTRTGAIVIVMCNGIWIFFFTIGTLKIMCFV